MRAPRLVHQLTPLALAALPLLVGLAVAQGPAGKSGSIFSAAEAAVAARRVESTKALGFHDRKGVFRELPADGAVLVGFDVGVGKFGDIETVYALRAIYQTAHGETSGPEHGMFYGQRKVGRRTHKSRVVRRVRLLAQRGYAVGGLTLRSGLNINGLALTYMRIDARGLDPEHSYTSEWVGDRTGGGESSVSGDGAVVIGVHGSQDVEHVTSLGLITMNPPPVVAQAPPRAETPPEPPAPPPRAEEPPPPVAPPPPPKEEPAQAPAPAPKEKQAEAPAAANPARDEDRPWPEPKPKSQRVAQAQPTSTASPGGSRSTAPLLAMSILLVTGLLAALGNYMRKRQFLDRSAGALDLNPLRKPARPKAPAAPAQPEAPPAAAPSTGVCERPGHAHDCGRHAAPERPAEERPAPARGADAQWGEPPCAKPNARVYYHVTCGKATIVSGDDYVLLECPFRPVSSTYCCGCQTFVPLHTVRWADSDELVSAYRERVRAMVPFWRQVYLALFATAYEGAVNWGKEWKGEPLTDRG